MRFTIGSLFDGSGTAPLAATILGGTPLWASEIEPYPVAVTKARFPKMQHLGDITKINGAEVAPVDIIAGGSPCQDLSVAGKQAGLEAGTRSNLFYQMTRIIREMRGATNGKYPRFVVWENVPGAFSSNQGRDFLAVIEAFCAIADDGVYIARPAADKTGRLAWANAGAVVGDGWSFAWRVLDAQYWGVPQRRRRIFAVLDFGSECAGEILFERTRLPWDTEPSGETGQGAPADAVGCTDRGGGDGLTHPEVWHTMTALNARCAESAQQPNCVVYPTGVVGALCARADSSPCIDRGQPFVAYESGQGYWMPGFGCLRAEGENRPSRPSHCVYALQGNGIDRALTAGCNGCGWREGEMYTLNTIDRPAVCYEDVHPAACGTLAASGAGTNRPAGQGNETDFCIVQNTGRGWWNNGEVAQTLRTPCGGDSTKANLVVQKRSRYIIRRLTPTECARLQGFPDWWTDSVPGSDSAKYKMWGNGMAFPCVLAVLNGIKAVMV